MKTMRPTWDEYFLKIAMLAAERSTCQRHQVGAIIVKNKQVLSSGYNGAVKGIKDCLERGCLRNELNIPSGTRHEICRAVHAEQNAIAQAAHHGISISGGTLYCTHSPCIICAKMIVNSGLLRVCSYHDYPDKSSLELFQETGIEFVKLKRPCPTIQTVE